jgi:uncharacterized oligopeptide transporter (OPT) family protein
MESNKISDNVSEISGNIKEYVRMKIDLMRLTLTEKMARLASFAVLIVVFCILFLFFSLFVSFAFILWFRANAGPAYIGALIVAAFYLVLGILIYLMRNTILVNPFISMLSKVFLKDPDEDEE